MQSWSGDIALIWSARAGHEQSIIALLQHPRIDPNIQSTYGNTALIWAARAGHEQAVIALLQHPQTNPNMQSWSGDTALTIASKKGYDSIVSVIRKRSTTTVRQTARFAYQNRYGAVRIGFFAGLPDEINKSIAALTGDPSVHTEEQANKIAIAGYRGIFQP